MSANGPLGRMNPNSRNQRWSKWVFDVFPGDRRPAFAVINLNAARFARRVFGSAGAQRVTELYRNGRYVITIEARVEGHPVHDPAYVEWMTAQWARWAQKGFGPTAVVVLVLAKLDAGDRQDGTPADQLIMLERPATLQ